MKYEKSCGAVVFDGIKILIIQQKKGHWGFPKGHVEKNETEIETALREVKEETNYDININKRFRYVETYSPAENITKDVVYFIAEVAGGEPKVQPEEVRAMKWVTYEQGLKKLSHENSRKVLRNAWADYNKIK